ncbi:OmpA family protein [Chondromyces crocatus]|uniref:Porin n=1 Tax=Chondromyces crocatus TaxID=52 RepID=A0A0K1E9E1_CHOCO|nr:OmpA family protein [Chondromyces crocatus]AKT37490.1 porin [Chondromyces crocatus]
MHARTRITHRTTASAVFLCLSALAGSALAQTQPAAEGFALSRFQPAPAGDRMFGVPSPFAAGPMTPHVMLLGDYAQEPLVLRSSDNEDLGAVVGNQFLLHLNVSMALWNRITLNVNMPFAFQGGSGGSVNGTALPAPNGAGLGDLRLGARGTLFGDYHDAFQIAIGGYVWLPTGSREAYAGDGGVRGVPQLIVGGMVDRFIWTASAGVELRPTTAFANVESGTMVQWGAGLGYQVSEDRRLQLNAELAGGVGLGDTQLRTTNVELLLGGRYRFAGAMEAGLGVGPGLTPGIGTPSFRGVALLAYTPEVKPPVVDRDGDGIADVDDACPDVKGVASEDRSKHGCPPPPPDTDKDGILDAQDACPTEPGVPNVDPAKHGCPPPKDLDKDGILDPDDACPGIPGVADPDPKLNGCPPPDRDGDGVPDKVDVCPDIPGVATNDPQTNGCPPDTDGDGIRDDSDACPREKGKPNADPEKHGCPTAVRVTEKEIIILQQVQFDTAKATIRAVSNELLDEVAGVLADHPEILKIEVQGHTDNRGAAAYNRKLSQDRADSVVKALAQRGIAASRLSAKGYGPDTPIADNKTEAGRQKNRRVQFQITEKQSKEPADPDQTDAQPATSPGSPSSQPQPAQPQNR